MTAMEALHLQGIGGSDISDICSLPPYGCARRLWYQKTQQEPDRAPKDNAVFDRGHALEPIIIDALAKRLGAPAEARETVYHPEHRQLFVHPDAWFTRDGAAVYGECKTMGREIFHPMVKEGVPDYYIVQVQYGMEIVRLRAEAGDPLFPVVPGGAVFGILWPDGWQFHFVPVKRHPGMGKNLVASALDWWSRFMERGEEPARLEPSDKRCSKCDYRTTCQGKRMLEVAEEKHGRGDIPFVDMGEEFDYLLRRYTDAQEAESAAKAEVERLKKVIKDKLGDQQAVEVPGYRIYFRAHEVKGYTVEPGVRRELRIYAR